MKLRVLVLLLFFSFGFHQHGFSQNSEGSTSVYFLSFKHFKSSFRKELGFSFLSHYAVSPVMAEYNLVASGVSYPQPVFNRLFGVFAMTYEPQFRLMELGSNMSISLDLPITGALSTVDLRTRSGISYSTEEVTANDISTGIYAKERSSSLGALNSELGALLSLNLFQGSTIENTNGAGLSFSAGVNYITAPLMMNFLEGYQRSDCQGMLSWASVVSRLGLRFGRVSMYYMIGVNPTRVIYFGDMGNEKRTLSNTYNRFSISFRLGR